MISAHDDSERINIAKVRVLRSIDSDLGPRQGTCGPSTIYVGDQHRGLLLRSAKSVAARFQ